MSHPEHTMQREIAPGVWDIAFPMHPKGWLGFKVRRACRKRGGHWWHPEPGTMIDWRCCACGAAADGMPRDGS